jgi:peptide/nickel transport system substrate-binding protein
MAEHRGARPLSRRELLAGAGTGVLAMYLVGCDHSSSKAPRTTGAGPVTSGRDTATDGEAVGIGVPGPSAVGGTPGGRLVVVFHAAGNSNDPAIAQTGAGWDSICNLTYASLYAYSDTNDPQPDCALDLPQISADGLTYTIPLREGVMFHNDREVTADDYVYAWDRVLDPATGSWAASYLYPIQGAKERYEDGAATVTGLKALNPRTIQVTLVKPDVTFLYALTQPFMAPVPKEEVDKYGTDFQSHVVGNGPFKLTTYDPSGKTMLFDRHDGYHWHGLPYVDQVEYRWGVNPGVQIRQLSKSQADVLADGLDPLNLAKMRSDPKLKNQIVEQPLFAQRWVSLDQSRQRLFQDPRVRQALNYATDRHALTRVTGDTAVTFGAPFPKDLPGFPRTFKPYAYDPEKAKALLAEAGVIRPTFEFWLRSDRSDELRLGQILQQQWAAVGISAKIRGAANSEALEQLTIENECDAWFSRYDGAYPTMLDLVGQYYETDGASNFTHYSNPQIDELTAKARQTTEEVARDTVLAKVEQLLGDDAVHVYLQSGNWLMGVDRRRVKNFHYSGVYGSYYDRLWLA